MPLVSSSHRSPLLLRGGHAQTIVPALLWRVPRLALERERLELADGDFLDLDWLAEGRERLALVAHGLEGSSRAGYVRRMALALWRAGWDVLAWNFRGCGGEPNRLPRFYHSGASEDLAELLRHALARHPAARVDLLGFSLGGNLTLKFLAEAGALPRLHRAVVFSVPCDLACSARQLARAANRPYMRRFLRDLHAKLREKARRFPEVINLRGFAEIRDFQGFDDRYTAPLHGFRDAADYWARSSSRPLLHRIRHPALLVNAANDPFLGPGCHPMEEARASEHLFFEQPAAGGHVGFPATVRGWAEQRAISFLSGHEPA